MERVKIRKLPSQAKVVGTLVTLAGATLMTLYKGPIIEMVWSKGRTHHASGSSSGNQNWMKGTIMLLASCTGWAGFFVLQVSHEHMYHYCPRLIFSYHCIIRIYTKFEQLLQHVQ